MDPYWEELEIWTIVRGFVTAGTALVLAIFFLTSFCTVRARSDPARVSFVWWLRLAFIAQIIGLPLHTTNAFADIRVQTWENEPWRATRDVSSYNTITLAYDIRVRAGSAGLVFTRISEICLAICFVELGNALLFALSKQRTTSQKALRWTTISIGFVLAVLAIAHAALHNGAVRSQWYAVLDYKPNSTDPQENNRVFAAIESYAAEVTAFRRIGGSYNIISFVVNLGVMIYASVVMHYYTRVQPRTSAVNFLVATILNLCRWISILVTTALWYLPDDGPAVVPTIGAEFGSDVFMNIILYGVILIILFSIGVHKRRGIWTTLQPWMGGVMPTLAVKAPTIYGPPQMHQPVIFQQGQYPQGSMSQQFHGQYQQQYQQYPQQQYQPPHGWQGSPPPQQLQQQQGQYFYPQDQSREQVTRPNSELPTGQVAAHEMGKNEGSEYTQEVVDVRNQVAEQNNRQNA